ncbi:LlaJI family restriction endonuclease [Prevotella scopos JCM 17725]|uniref:LlaJI restriction endonuclease n=1 Tax=Prevotella scopos JCM 17725 TaxID=1236518 RepID=A0AAX2F3C8_9BACT|nr:LlaJI family restriction endonuclease [Prevotella scopos]ANR73791.1 restriction endonuclease [Prevotella scopos JCM 17725]QUB44382.1 LlaJI family restriction endonuclease [Prevotella scopos JCM 17725]SHF74916.1 LlaJI restriction endonuclease [Prevotella scopos JCM 17725]
MRVIIEGYCYRASAVRDVLHELSPLENVEGEISVGYVGYYYHPQLRDCVFILPKVLVNEENKVFSRLDPHDIIDLDNCTELLSEERSFIYEFAVWIYRAIEVFNKSNPKNDIVYRRQIAEMGKGKRMLSNTFLDILLSLLRFNKEQHSFFTTILRNLHSGYNKINWTRTISRSAAWVQDGRPVYLNPVNKKRQINTDEELIIIYFSILNHISETYGFPVDISLGFELIKGRKFEHYLKGYGKRRLQQIKYRYFSDIQLRLWELCYAFFDKAHQIHIVAEQREYLLVKNFNIVFEAIIDELIGDKEPPRGLKEQDDGKRVDHIYSYRNLTNNEEDKPIYYIGDSKYYKIGNQVSAESVYKQFTYARNVIQWNLNLFLDESKENKELQKTHPKYRDDRTEGYNVVPNFFISAKMDEKLSYADNISASDRKENTFLSRHFTNRLFDRDTLLVYHYDVNFLYVVSLYARENKFQKAQWKEKVRELFREKIQAALTEKYAFYAMRAKPGVDDKEYLETHFQQLLGKVYMPFQQYDDIYSLALDNDEKCQQENKLLLEQLEAYFFVEPCPLGHDPQQVLPKTDDAILRLLPANVTEKNVLTCLVRKGDSNYKVFENHAGKTYIMERVPNINLLGITYLLPMVGGCIDGYYDVNRMSIDVKDGVPVLRLRLGDYHALGASRVQIYRTKMQPGELISLEQTMKLYET